MDFFREEKDTRKVVQWNLVKRELFKGERPLLLFKMACISTNLALGSALWDNKWPQWHQIYRSLKRRSSSLEADFEKGGRKMPFKDQLAYCQENLKITPSSSAISRIWTDREKSREGLLDQFTR